jgi:hypothetical protein
MKILKGVIKEDNFNKPGTLNQWSQYLLGKNKLFNNKQIIELYIEGRIKEIIEYNKRDLELTYEIWKKIEFVL